MVQKSSIQTSPSNSVLGTPCLRPHVTKVSTVPKEREDQSPMYTAVKSPSRSLWSPKKRSLDCDPPVRMDYVLLFLRIATTYSRLAHFQNLFRNLKV